jgi:hypothetical protein
MYKLMNPLLICLVLLGANETHIHVIDKDTGKPVSNILIFLGDPQSYFGTTSQGGSTDIRPLVKNPKREYTPERGYVSYLNVFIQSSEYDLVPKNFKILWHNDRELKDGFALQLKKKQAGYPAQSSYPPSAYVYPKNYCDRSVIYITPSNSYWTSCATPNYSPSCPQPVCETVCRPIEYCNVTPAPMTYVSTVYTPVRVYSTPYTTYYSPVISPATVYSTSWPCVSNALPVLSSPSPYCR